LRLRSTGFIQRSRHISKASRYQSFWVSTRSLRDPPSTKFFTARETIRWSRIPDWRMREGEWFEGCYVFATSADRAAFQETFTAGAAESPGSQIIGSPPILIEECDVVAVAEGGAGFLATPSYDA